MTDLPRRQVIIKDPAWKAKAATKRKKRISEKRRTAPKSKTQVKDQCDRTFSRLIRARGVCAVQSRPTTEERYGTGDDEVVEYARCLKDRGLQCAHVISRSYLAVRWDERNAVCLCQPCHMYFTYHPLEWEVWVQDYMGIKEYLTIRQIALSQIKTDYPAMLAHLERRLLEVSPNPHR